VHFITPENDRPDKRCSVATHGQDFSSVTSESVPNVKVLRCCFYLAIRVSVTHRPCNLPEVFKPNSLHPVLQASHDLSAFSYV